MTDLTIGGETFCVKVEGETTRPPLILSNSLGTDLSMWDAQVPALTRHFRVIRYDPRGHGRSRTDGRPTSIAQLGRDALAILDALEIDRAHWLGLSMGGAVGLWLLVNAPGRIGRAVLANTAARLGSPETWNARIASVLGGGMAANADATIERWFSPSFATREKSRVEAIRSMLREVSPEGYAAACAALRDMDLRASLDAIASEVLVVIGRDDPVIPTGDADALVAGIAGARHVVLEARHMSNIEAEADFNAAVTGFLTRPSRRAEPSSARKPATRKAPAAKAETVKRGGVSRRSNPARNPLKAAAKKAAASKTRAPRKALATRKASAAGKAASPHRRSAATRAAPRPVAKASPSRPAPKKSASKTATTRRKTSTAAARGPVKKPKPTKRPTKTTVKKVASKSTTKKLPAPRRKPARKPRRPAGRRPS